MNRLLLSILPVTAVLLLTIQQAQAAKVVTLYPDGAVVSRGERASGGYLEISIPSSAKADSLRIRPSGGTEIRRVQVVARQPSKKLAKELAAIRERREQLEDRLKALAIREDIFRSAAKSQSAKAPRRTKANPDPMGSIRQGTDYAITQLEAVFQARRRAEKELKQLNEKQATLSRNEQSGGTVARVWVTPSAGIVNAAYLEPDRTWQPAYELKAAGKDTVRLSILPGQLHRRQDESLEVALGSFQGDKPSTSWKVADETTVVKIVDLKVTRMNDILEHMPVLSLSMVNQSELNLPPGEVSCYAEGAYLGRGRFPGMDRGSSLDFRCNGN